MFDDPLALLIYVIAGIAAAALNAVAGGGTFFTFPLLIFFGLPSDTANMTSKVGLTWGAVASIGGYNKEIAANKKLLLPLTIVGVVGSVMGSLLLLVTSSEQFSAMVPWLMLFATILFGWGRKILGWLQPKRGDAGIGRISSLMGQGAIGIYGGFFGAGIGILMMALFELMGIRNVHQMNGLKVLVASAVNAVSMAVFVFAGLVAWSVAVPLGLGAIIGGYYGAFFARRLPQKPVRLGIIIYGCIVTLYFFIQ